MPLDKGPNGELTSMTKTKSQLAEIDGINRDINRLIDKRNRIQDDLEYREGLTSLIRPEHVG